MPDPEMTAAEQTACEEALKRIGECARRRATALDLRGLGLTRLPARISQLVKLTELDLSHNRLASVPSELVGLVQLTRLNLSHNPLEVLPPEFGQLGALTVLDLSHTRLAALPAEIGRLLQLTRLDLCHLPLASLPPEVGQLSRLTRLYLTHTQLAELPAELGGWTGLTRLYLSHNRLGCLPPEIGGLASLTRLDVSHNQLAALPAELGRLERLTVLDASHNMLDSLPAALGGLARLTVLSLMANRLVALPDQLGELESLESLWLHDNPGLQLAPTVLGADPRQSGQGGVRPATAKAILGFYFARLTGRTRPLNEVKVVMLGRAGAGKTSMVRVLRDLPFREREESTLGVALSDWLMDSGPDGPVTAHVWDFSGQEITEVLHPFFFSPRCLYVVVLSGRDRSERADAAAWLRLIEQRAADDHGQVPPVIVALNQWNVPGCRPEVDRNALRERYPFIRGFVEIDCKAKKGIPVLKAALGREVERMPWVREPMPEPWHAVRQALAAGAARLTAADYRALCVQQGVSDEGPQDYLLEISQQLGTSINYQNIPLLHEAAVVQPEWLTRQVYALLRRAHALAGLLTPHDVALVVHAEKDAPARGWLMLLLEHFGIARALQAGAPGGWLVAAALPHAPPAALGAFEDAAEEAIRLRWVYQEMPDDLLARLLVRRHGFVEDLREQKQQWRDGVVLARKGARAVIGIDPGGRQLRVTVIGPARPRLELAELCQAEWSEIHGAFPGLEPILESQIHGEWVAASDPSQSRQGQESAAPL